jgi:probable F420-dependent oxidoreductase
MRIGAIFPQTEIGVDPAAIRDYAQAIEEMDFAHILAYDHVLGADTASRPDWQGPYTSESLFHEPFALFGYLAALTQQIELVTGVIILPQRQTALVAKQAAEIDILSGGRLRLGVGVGWNSVEFQALGEDFHTRGARCDEQIAVLRTLWREPAVTFSARFHTIEAAGINPLPVRRTIPIWIGGHADAALRRAGRLGDGWLPQGAPNARMREQVAVIRRYASEAGRSEDAVGIEARLTIARTPESDWATYTQAWRELGATHLSVNTMGAGLASPRDHIAALRRVKAALSDVFTR